MSSTPPTPTAGPDLTWLSGLSGLAGLIPNPAVSLGVALALKYGPAAYAAFVVLLHKANPTVADYMVLLKEISDLPTYNEYAAKVGLPPLTNPDAV